MARIKTTDISTDKVKEIKKRAYQWGIIAERIAIIMLLSKGYRIIKRRYRSVHGEVDIIAAKRKTTVFVEVKARRNKAEAAESIQPRQKLRIEKTAKGFMVKNPEYINNLVRFDVVCVAPWQKPLHIEDAWRPKI